MFQIQPIAYIHTDFPSKFGIPHQSGRIPSLKSTLVFEPEYRNPEAFRGLEDFTHLWLIWQFSQVSEKKWSPTVRPPRLGGNIRKGVFATRSPFRPNHLGLSSVKLEKIEFDPVLGPILHILGADLMDGTPVFDIKPYIPMDCHPDAAGGFTNLIKDHQLKVNFPPELLEKIPYSKRESLLAVLANDPRPGYQKDPQRIYGMPFGTQDIHFRVVEDTLTVLSITVFSQ